MHSSASNNTFEVRLLSGVLGAEISGLDLSQPLRPAIIDELRAAFVEHAVLVFRDQDLTAEQQVAFGRCFGVLDTHPFVDGRPDQPEVIDIVTEPDDRFNFGGGWHTDVTFLERPDLGSILSAVELPRAGGDTLFADQRAAYDALSSTMKGIIDGLTAHHSAIRQYGTGGQSTRSSAIGTKNPDAAARRVEHPVVCVHPETGRRALYVNRAFTIDIVGMSPAESQALLEFLFQHGVSERFTCRVRWEPGSVAMWDNRSVQHYALHDYAGHARRMRRITIQGDRPTAPAPTQRGA